jgi:hypothetical protein
LDQREKVRRELRGQLYGLHLGAYLLPVLAALWSIGEMVPFLWTFGCLIAIFSVSAYLVHKNRHPAWEAIARLSLDRFDLGAIPMIRDAFFWLAAWSLPIWATLLLWQLGVVVSFGYLGYTGSAIVFLALAARLRRIDRTYAWALMSAGGFFTLLSLLQSAGITLSLFGFQRIVSISEGDKALVLGYVIVQALAAAYWAGSSAYYAHKIWAARLFSILAAALVWVPYSLAWQVFGFGIPAPALGFAWIGLAAALLLAGFGLDWLERRRDGQRRVGYAHGPYLSGYLGLAYALLWSWPDRLIALYVLGSGIVLSSFPTWRSITAATTAGGILRDCSPGEGRRSRPWCGPVSSGSQLTPFRSGWSICWPTTPYRSPGAVWPWHWRRRCTWRRGWRSGQGIRGRPGRSSARPTC